MVGRRGSLSGGEFDCAESTCDMLASSSCTSCPLCGIVCHHHDTVRSLPIREPLLGNECRHMDQSDLTGKIIGCALKIHSILGPALLESAFNVVHLRDEIRRVYPHSVRHANERGDETS